jgi:hypothetical protein
MDARLFTALSKIIKDTERLELRVGKTLKGGDICRFSDNYYLCSLPYEKVPTQEDYHRLLTNLVGGAPVRWRPDITILRTFREEVINYQNSLKELPKRQSNSLSRWSRIRLMEE